MKTIVITKIYEVRASAKGWSEADAYYFNKERALNYAELKNKAEQERNGKIHYQVYECLTDDAIIYTEEEA